MRNERNDLAAGVALEVELRVGAIE